MNQIRKIGLSVVIILSLSLIVVSANAVAPTQEAIEQWELEGVLREKLDIFNKAREAGWCKPSEHPMIDKQARRSQLALGQQVTDTINVMVILVDFTDQRYTVGAAGTPHTFDSILFSDRNIDSVFNPTGSMTEYYMENSHGTFYIKGDIYGWYTMPQTYAYYVGGDNGVSRSSLLVRDAAAAADSAGADFSIYDNNYDSRVDGLIVIHSGRGAEEGADPAIWSHKSEVYPPVSYDGVLVSDYTMNPEETGQGNPSLSNIGVFCHEFGHFIGLPDLYDTDYVPATSDGLGRWGLMAAGNILGGSKKPAHLTAWSKERVGFIQYTDVTIDNWSRAEIPAAEFNPVAYRLTPDSTKPEEYWVVENRQRIGFDQYIPTSGLAIYHVDEGVSISSGNINSDRYLVALEQADGQNDLALTQYNNGDGGDLFPGGRNVRAFNNMTNPGSWTNNAPPFTFGIPTQVSVWNISNSDSVMYADLDLTYSRPLISLSGTSPLVFDDSDGGDGDGLLEAGETIRFYATIKNDMRGSYNVYASLQTTSDNVTFITQSTPFKSPANDNLFDVYRPMTLPIVFKLADEMISSIDSFTLVITTDSLDTTPGSGEFTTSFVFEQTLGAPQILIVDDDRGKSYQTKYEEAFYRLRVPTRTWSKQSSGTPSDTDLAGYNMVFWHTGDSTSNALNSTDIASMKGYMDRGGNLMLTTSSGALDLSSLDPSFVADYFKCNVASAVFWPQMLGIAGSTLGDGLLMMFDFNTPFSSQVELLPLSGGEAVVEAKVGVMPYPVVGVSHKSAYSSVLLTFGLEFLRQDFDMNMDSVLARTIGYFGGLTTDIYDGSPFQSLPSNFDLAQNYPNPFNPSTTISYTLRAAGSANEAPPRAVLSVYNLLGQHIKTLVDQVQIPGQYEVVWDGTNRSGQQVASGIYFYRLQRGDDSETRKMLMIR